MMTMAQGLLAEYDGMIGNVRRTLERVPEENIGWVPHAKSMPIGRLAMHCATLPMLGVYIVEDDGMDLANSTRPRTPLVFESRSACLAALADSAAQCRAALAGATDESLMQRWRFSFGEHLISDESRVGSLRSMCFNHLVHHTAQLGVYLRLMEVPVPALYGPSADEQWTPPS